MHNDKVFNVIELFSGIGSQAEALTDIGANFNIINTCEWNIHAMLAYSLIHGIDNENNPFPGNKNQLIDYLLEAGVSNDGKNPINRIGLQGLNEETLRNIYNALINTKNLVDISKVTGEMLSDEIDIMTYSFPCQDLSNVGAFHGYKSGIDRDAHSRSGLLWEVERILLERKEQDLYLPHFLLMENVPALNNGRHRKNFEEWQRQLCDLGYYNKQYLLNAKDFGLPQNRERLLMLSILTYNDEDIEKLLDDYFKKNDLESEAYRESIGVERGNLSDFLKTDYTNEKYCKEAEECQPNKTASRMKIWEENPQLTDCFGNVDDGKITATITTKQDRHPNSGNLAVSFNNGKAPFRYLTPRECFLLMGFKESEYDTIIDNNFEIKKNAMFFTRDNLIKMAGNSIAVNVLVAVFRQVVKLDSILFI